MLKGKRNQHHLLQKLYNRELWSSFYPRCIAPHNRARQLFRAIPDRLMFYLRDILQHIGNHVLLGSTQCGQFLITYSYGTEQQTMFKYRLHWWAFKPGAPAYKVAEVQLFDNDEISSALSIGIAQWPNVNNRLVAYGFCHDDADEEHEEGYVECRRYYLTVTTLPSLHNCKDCRMVAASFDEEDMAANWDSCIGLSCLKHGYTIHSFFEVDHPYPPFDIKISLKCANSIIINTGNFLHVLTIDLETPNSKTRTECDSIVPAEIKHRVEGPLSKAGLFYISPWSIDVSYKHMSILNSDTTSESGSDVMDSSPRDPWLSEASLCLKPMWTKRIPKLAAKPLPKKTMDWLTKITDQAEKAYAFKEPDDGCELKFKWYRRRRLADKMYEFSSDDEDMENIQPSPKIPRFRFTPDFMDLRETKLFCGQIAKTQIPENTIEVNNENDSVEGQGQLVSNKDCVQISSPEFEIVDIKPTASKRSGEELDSECSVRSSLTSPYNVLEYQEKKDGANVNNMQALSQIVISPIEKELDNFDHRNNTSDVNNKFTLSDNNYSGDIRLSSTILSNAEVPKSIPGNIICSSHNYDIKNPLNMSPSTAPTMFTELTLKTDDFTKIDMSCNKAMNPDLKAIIADWEADSLSPKSDAIIGRTKESKNEVIQRFLELLPGLSSKCNKVSSSFSCRKMYCDKMNTQGYLRAQDVEDFSQDSVNLGDTKQRVSKFPPIRVALKPRNRNKSKVSTRLKQNLSEERIKPVPKENKVIVQKELLFGRQIIPGCSVQFDRRYIEEDGEIISTTTDIEDDDQGTGYHCALPLSVHGSAYAQMQMITNHKAGKVNVPCGLVRQATLDIEQVCFKAADIICNCEGYKFWFCSDYDVEIIDVCPLNGDILALVCMRMNAEKRYPRPEKKTNNAWFVDHREFYVCHCVFVWNPEQDQCWLEVYSPLASGPLPSAKPEAALIKSKLPSDSLFTLPTYPPMRSYTHNMWSGDRVLVASLEVLRDHMNLIGFRLRRCQGSLQVVRSCSRTQSNQSALNLPEERY